MGPVYAEVGYVASNPGTFTPATSPTPGNLLVITAHTRAWSDVLAGITGWTIVESVLETAGALNDSGLSMFYRIAEAGDTGWTIAASQCDVNYSEWSGYGELLVSASDQVAAAGSSSAVVLCGGPVSPPGSAPVLVIGTMSAGFENDTATMSTVPDSGVTELDDKGGANTNPGRWTGYLETGAPPGGPYTISGVATVSGAGIDQAGITAVFGGESDPPEDTGPDPDPYVDPLPAPAILEIWVHDESASRWGVATWATGPATGTEGIWSASGWTDVTPEGVTAHVRFGASRGERGILARQEAASWNIETYDPDRRLDPGNPDSPYAPQLLPGLPIRISHRGIVARTGVVYELSYSVKGPDYTGQILATDTIALMAQAMVPEDSILRDELLTRAQDAIEAGGIAVGGIPLPPNRSGFPPHPLGTDLSPRLEGERSVWDHVRLAAEEVGWIVAVNAAGGIYFRPYGAPYRRGREVAAPILTDLVSYVNEDGMYSVVRVNNADDTAFVTRAADPLPRYGRRVYERRETTFDPDEFAAAVLADRAWPGVRWRPGSIRPRTAADADLLASMLIHERITVSVPGIVTIDGTIVGGEFWTQHRAGADGATWRWRFNLITEGSSAIGTTTLVSDGAGDTLLDDATETDYLEPDE